VGPVVGRVQEAQQVLQWMDDQTATS